MDFTKLSADELDRYAWAAICTWPDYADIDVVKNGLNHGELTRFFLWDKVARALRRQAQKKEFVFEDELIAKQTAEKPSCPASDPHPSPPLHTFSSPSLFNRITARMNNLKFSLNLKQKSPFKKKPVIYVPFVSPPLKNIVSKLFDSNEIHILAPPLEENLKKSFLQIKRSCVITPAEMTYAEKLFKTICHALNEQKINLLDYDAKLLMQQIVDQLAYIKGVEEELRTFRPEVILVHADNHPPHQLYVFVARRRGIPSVMLQHGLDCEQYCHDEAYASHIAVWGKARMVRYQNDSNYQPVIQVTGNPQYDPFTLPEKMDCNGSYWLWITRPHTPEKCYSPSRIPAEGIHIFKALVSSLEKYQNAHLIIKPHPNDYSYLYEEYIKETGLADRISVSDARLHDLLPGARLVITEDSTGGMEAIFYGKPVIHAHFAKSPTTVPFAKYGAALPAFSPELFPETMNHVLHLSQSEQSQMLESQKAFLQDNAGPCDGRAGERLVSFIREIAHSV